MNYLEQIKEYGIYLVIITLGIMGIFFAQGRPFAEYLSLFVFKPGVKLMILMAVAQFSFRDIDFMQEIKKANVAAAITFFAIAYVVAEAI
jgi:hypothetical protein